MRTLGSLRIRHRLVGAVVALALGCSVLILSSAQPAQAALFTYQPQGFGCVAGGQLNANPPKMTSVSGGLETVWWSPDLYRWNFTTRTWYLYDGSKPWYYAAANGNGVVNQQYTGATWFQPSGIGLNYAVFGNLPAGYYKVLDYYAWSNGARASAWSPFLGSGGGYHCVFS